MQWLFKVYFKFRKGVSYEHISVLKKLLFGPFYILKLSFIPYKMVQLRAFFRADLRSCEYGLKVLPSAYEQSTKVGLSQRYCLRTNCYIHSTGI